MTAPTHPPGRGRDAGLGLVELLVAMALGTLVLTALAAVYTTGLRTTSVVTAKTSVTQDVAQAADVVARRLRVAVPSEETVPAVVTAEDRRLSFYASLAVPGSVAAADPPPTLVTYAYDDARRCLTETLTTGTGTTPPYGYTTGARTTCLLRGQVDGTLFTYYDAAEDGEITTTTSDVRAIDVTLTVTQGSGAGSATTRAGARAVLRNLI